MSNNNGTGIEQTKSKIFCFIEGGRPGWYQVSALAEDGEVLAGHISSSEGFAKHDIGIGSDWKHEQYKKKYPDGYELVWLKSEDLDVHPGFQKAFELNQQSIPVKK